MLYAIGAEVKNLQKLHANLFTSRKTGVHKVGAECGSNNILQHFYVLKHEVQQFSSSHLEDSLVVRFFTVLGMHL